MGQEKWKRATICAGKEDCLCSRCMVDLLNILSTFFIFMTISEPKFSFLLPCMCATSFIILESEVSCYVK